MSTSETEATGVLEDVVSELRDALAAQGVALIVNVGNDVVIVAITEDADAAHDLAHTVAIAGRRMIEGLP